MTREEAKQTILIKSKSYESAHQNYIHLLSLHKIIDDIFDEHEAQLKAKDEEIERLKEALEVLTVMCELGIKTQDKYSKIIQKMKVLNKARSIVAMLFWDWKKHKQTLKEKRDEENNETPSRDSLAWFWIVAQSEVLFKKAYAMLKATT